MRKPLLIPKQRLDGTESACRACVVACSGKRGGHRPRSPSMILPRPCGGCFDTSRNASTSWRAAGGSRTFLPPPTDRGWLGRLPECVLYNCFGSGLNESAIKYGQPERTRSHASCRKLQLEYGPGTARRSGHTVVAVRTQAAGPATAMGTGVPDGHKAWSTETRPSGWHPEGYNPLRFPRRPGMT